MPALETRLLSEFTGERLIPGQVDADLWNEHLSRYAFAASLCRGTERVLDAGCGSGYGSGVLGKVASSVIGVDSSEGAVAYAIEHYATDKVRFKVGACECLPEEDGAFDLVIGFEVIEHLSRWRDFLREASRVLAAGGLCVISTPNKNYYTESRGQSGPNPFHLHEFEFVEFREALQGSFPAVRVLSQNHAGAITFTTPESGNSSLACFQQKEIAVEEAAFFVAICSHGDLPDIPDFVFVPRTANVLREREKHIQLLMAEIGERVSDLRKLNVELEHSNNWALSLREQLQAKELRIAELQNELVREQQNALQVAQSLQTEIAQKNDWAASLDAQLTDKMDEVSRCVDLLHQAEATIDERTKWAQSVQAHADELTSRLDFLLRTPWMKVGRATGFGPR